MLAELVMKLADHRENNSLATQMRKKRFSLFNSFIESAPAPLKILDVGGTQAIWETDGFYKTMSRDVEIVILNIKKIKVNHPNIKSVVGDAKDMRQFEDNEFDVIFSNSVIEHLGDYEDQRRMAKEIKRVGKKYFMQTPNYYFPIEPHFLFPFFQFLPISIKVWLVTNFKLGWSKKITDKQEATAFVNSVKLLSKKQLIELFPSATITEEKFLGLSKSFMVYE